MITDQIEELVNAVHPLMLYGIAISLTVVVILYNKRMITLPRVAVLSFWYGVHLLALSWLLFHLYVFVGSKTQITGLAAIGRILMLVPVYICSLILLFVYPKRKLSA